MHFSALAAALVTLAVSGSVLAAPTGPVAVRDDNWPEYATEEECHAAGWEVCRRYATGPGTSVWVGFDGPAQPVPPKFDTQAECEAIYAECLGYKRADGHWVWTPVDWEGKRSLDARDDDWTEYETEEECHAAGWEVCRRYASGPGTSYWVGFPGPAQPTPPKFDTQEECEAIYGECLGYKRAAGYWVWIPAYWEGKRSLATRDDDWTEYETEEECHAAGWEVCRRYASGPGTNYWVGFPGPAQPTPPKFDTQEECEAIYGECLGYKRAAGYWVWIPAYWEGKRSLAARDDDWTEYETEEECHAAGWEVCRRYASGPGTNYWVGFPGPAQPTPPKFDTQEECEAIYGECLGYKRAAGYWVWIPAYWEGKRSLAAREEDPNWPEYETEEECHAAGWEVCRRYATGPGTSVWVGFPGPAPPEIPKFDTKEECEALYAFCIGYKRADGHWVWRPVDLEEEEPEEKRSVSARDDNWPEYETEEECHAAGWEVCRRYATGPGTSVWVGFSGPAQPEIPKFDTQAECEALYGECIGYKRAAGNWVWIPVDWY